MTQNNDTTESSRIMKGRMGTPIKFVKKQSNQTTSIGFNNYRVERIKEHQSQKSSTIPPKDPETEA